ncbi:hypothetical protein LshimejAT787_0108720 [Lyophyllum shimeji]|uniref:Uncharacterized protein n=1 Tax=Lyophyllum shimeji TaxID=47721 RepID=A0A9P3PDR1_LYOSH|nr:hypothetical protein LshimejAT787_0108720 [Lyophyllum shimeji]
MKIEWASSFRADGSRRKPPPSTVHGWLAKMRGTLLGNETLRTKGMREMQAARIYKRKRNVQSGRSIFGFFSSRKNYTFSPFSLSAVDHHIAWYRLQAAIDDAESQPDQSIQSFPATVHLAKIHPPVTATLVRVLSTSAGCHCYLSLHLIL